MLSKADLFCPECHFELDARLRCPCGFKGWRIDGIPILVPQRAAAKYSDSNHFLRRLGPGWKRLASENPRRLVADASRLPLREISRAFPVTKREAEAARKASSRRLLKAQVTPDHEPDEPIDWLCSAVRKRNPKRVLDIGCGGGFLTEGLLRSKAVSKYSLTSLDIDFLCLKVTQARSKLSSGITPRIIGGDAKQVPYPNHYFDCVVSNFGLWHMERFPVALKEIFRILRPYGVFLAAEMAHASLHPNLNRNQSRALAAAFGMYGGIGKLQRAMEKTGFKNIRVRKRKSRFLDWAEIEGRRTL